MNLGEGEGRGKKPKENYQGICLFILWMLVGFIYAVRDNSLMKCTSKLLIILLLRIGKKQEEIMTEFKSDE